MADGAPQFETIEGSRTFSGRSTPLKDIVKFGDIYYVLQGVVHVEGRVGSVEVTDDPAGDLLDSAARRCTTSPT
jgi:hypothetical protein